jgi:hypothetical protein
MRKNVPSTSLCEVLPLQKLEIHNNLCINSWLSDIQEKGQDMQYHIWVNSILENPQVIQEASHFPDELMYFYHNGSARCLPQLPALHTIVNPAVVPGGPTEQLVPPS